MDEFGEVKIPFLTHFLELDDCRANNKSHKLLYILFLSVCAVLCGASNCVSIADFAKARLAWLRRFVALEGGAPSHDTISRVLASIDPVQFEKLFVNWTAAIQTKTKDEVLAIDGKTLRGSYDSANGLGAIHMVSAWASANGLVLGQYKVNDKSNEITAIPQLLNMLDIEGRVVTVDAMGTQKEIARQIIEQKGDYMMAVKDNHPNLAADIGSFFKRNRDNNWLDGNADIVPHSKFRTVDGDHGRIETRTCWCSGELADIDGVSAWKGMQSIIMVESQRQSNGKTSTEQRYYISSLAPRAKRCLEVTRTHWSIENNLHWVLDVAFREDEARTRKGSGAQIHSALNKIVINLCKQNKRRMSINRKRQLASWDTAFLDELLLGNC